MNYLVNFNIIRDSLVESEPFFHSEYTGYLNDNLYDTLIEEVDELEREDYEFPYEDAPNRGVINLMLKKPCNSLGLLIDWFKSKDFLGLYIKKYGEYLKRFHDHTNIDRYFVKPYLVRDHNGWETLPHTDIGNKALTIIIPLVRDDTLIRFGTSLLAREKKCGYDDWEEFNDSFDEFIEVKRFKFLPNNVFEFVVAPNSWHGVKKISLPDGVVRNQINISIFFRE